MSLTIEPLTDGTAIYINESELYTYFYRNVGVGFFLPFEEEKPRMITFIKKFFSVIVTTQM